MTQNLGSTSNPLSMTGEQWVLEERTDDPLSPDPGECWIRTDLNAGDKIATLKFGDGSEVPIFPTGTSEPGVLEVRRVQTGGQTGYLPVAEPDESRFPQFRLQHNNTVYSLHDDIEPSVIPDSAVHHYDATNLSLTDNDAVSTWTDEIGGNDLQATGSPIYVGDGLNGNPVVRYDGEDDYHDNDIIDLTQPYAIIWVVRDVAGNSSRMLAGMDPLSGDKENILSNDESGSRGMFAGSFVSGGSSDTNWNIWNAYFNTTESDLRINASTIGTGDVGGNNIGEYRVAANRGGDSFMQIDVGEMVVLNDPTADDRDSEDQRLSNKWGIPI